MNEDYRQQNPLLEVPNVTTSTGEASGSLERVVRGILVEWEAEADLLKSGNHPRRQNVPRRQVLQEECALRGCIADIKRVLDASNDKLTDGAGRNL
jgi:hypothetical protein